MTETTLPLGTVVTVRGMTGKDEDILTNQAKVRSGAAMNEIMANCTAHLALPGKDAKTKVLATDVERLREPERKSLLFAVRRESYGDMVRADLVCPSCKAKFSFSVDLSQLKMKNAPTVSDTDDTPDTGPYTRKLVLPDVDGVRTERSFTFDFLDGGREAEIAKAKEDVMTLAMFLRLRDVEGVKKGRLKDWLQSLSVADRKAIRDIIATTECGIDSACTADCESCGLEVEFDVTHQPGFFFPAE